MIMDYTGAGYSNEFYGLEGARDVSRHYLTWQYVVGKNSGKRRDIFRLE